MVDNRQATIPPLSSSVSRLIFTGHQNSIEAELISENSYPLVRVVKCIQHHCKCTQRYTTVIGSLCHGLRDLSLLSFSHSLVSYEDNIVLNLYEAFGTTAKKTSGSELQPLLVIEVSENKMFKRYMVPHKYAMEGKWLLYGRHIYVLKGHAFFEHKSSPTFVSCLLCVTTGFRMMQNFFKCTGEDNFSFFTVVT
ncbi:hypothetical protein TNCV_1429431 [Trichonephila clavipes]|nr:hypothetical protein TNCV_1429431 [Trichonephila clavipes]